MGQIVFSISSPTPFSTNAKMPETGHNKLDRSYRIKEQHDQNP
ncbi:hypothetical protein SAMN04487891_10650 [Flagellimonas taeanensis]|uniref:Uncharacterized protein n=1 Tax=Flagellimonas taeanensis TaxID=1005926 RepID=A0A1M6Z4S2_9FLAO|nr:hypothetical protein SAMN04487891_10650 [Allomuricauda taeanensis]SHL25410.1 hypothetical protein SAMN05216293_3070 [Allomuricauda taeanensis]